MLLPSSYVKRSYFAGPSFQSMMYGHGRGAVFTLLLLFRMMIFDISGLQVPHGTG